MKNARSHIKKLTPDNHKYKQTTQCTSKNEKGVIA